MLDIQEILEFLKSKWRMNGNNVLAKIVINSCLYKLKSLGVRGIKDEKRDIKHNFATKLKYNDKIDSYRHFETNAASIA